MKYRSHFINERAAVNWVSQRAEAGAYLNIRGFRALPDHSLAAIDEMTASELKKGLRGMRADYVILVSHHTYLGQDSARHTHGRRDYAGSLRASLLP